MPAKLTEQTKRKIADLRARKVTAPEIAEQLKVSESAVYRIAPKRMRKQSQSKRKKARKQRAQAVTRNVVVKNTAEFHVKPSREEEELKDLVIAMAKDLYKRRAG